MFKNPLDNVDIVGGIGNWFNNTFNDKDVTTQAYANKNKGVESYRAGGKIYNYGGDVIGTYNQPAKTTPTPTNNGSSDWAKESAALNARLAALTNQLAQQPKLPNFDILANYNKAKQTATAAVTPLYNKKLNIFLEGQGIKKDTKQKTTALARENSAIGEQTALEDNNVSRVRTGEDLANVLSSIGTNRENFLTDDAQQFDDARRALTEETAAGGAIDTGLGQQGIDRQLRDRNTAAGRQTDEFNNQEAAKQLLATRSLADLSISDTRSTQKRGQEDKATQIDFDSYMNSLANEETGFRLSNDLDMALEIARQTSSNQQQGVAQFIAGLAGQGYRAQDIALAKQVYG